MMLWLTGFALAGGGGLYAEWTVGGATTNSTGFLTSGASGSFGAGGYWGAYNGSYRYGPYWRVGFKLRAQGTRILAEGLESTVLPSLELIRGVDILRFGVFGGAQVGPAFFYRRSPFEEESAEVQTDIGVAVLGTGGLVYNQSHVLAISLRGTWGAQFDGQRLSNNRGLAIGLTVRLPVYRKKTEDEREEADRKQLEKAEGKVLSTQP